MKKELQSYIFGRVQGVSVMARIQKHLEHYY